MISFSLIRKLIFTILCLVNLIVATCFAQEIDDAYEVVLLGLFNNDNEVTTVDALKKKNNYYLPQSIMMSQLGIQPNETATEWLFHSPIGDARVAKSKVIIHRQQKYLPINTFEGLGVKSFYDQSSLSIKLYVPWDSQTPFPDKQKVDDNVVAKKNIDYYPQFGGLSGISINGGLNGYDIVTTKVNGEDVVETKTNSQYINVGLTGYLGGGLWGSELSYRRQSSNEHADSRIDNLYWTKSYNNWAVRLGTNNNSYGLGVDGYTGLTFAYSNKDIKKHLSFSGSGGSQLLHDNNNVLGRNIKGRGPSGGIAELRVDGRAIARVRIGLDKKYEFIGLNLSNYQSKDYSVEVALFEYSLSEPPIKIDRPFLSSRQSSVSTGELLIEFGAGKQGNVLNHNNKNYDSNSGVVAHSYAEYGLTNNIAIRGAVAKQAKIKNVDGIYESMVGVNLGLPFRINLDLSYQKLLSKKVYDLDINYESEYFNFNYGYEHNDHTNNTSSSDDTHIQQHANITIKPNENFDLHLHGTHKENYINKSEKYFTARLNARLHKDVRASIYKDRYNDYSYSLDWHVPQWQSHLYSDWDKDKKKIGVSTNITDFLDVGASVTHWNGKKSEHYHAYLDYEYNDKNRFHVGVGYAEQENSYDVNWQYRHNDFGLVSLGYRKNQSVAEQSITSSNSFMNETNYFYLQFNFDFVNKGDGSFDFGSHRASHYGTVVANLELDDTGDKDELVLDDDVQIKLDGHAVEARKVSDSQYYIENVNPGIYELEFPIHSLPIEYQSENEKKYVIKVAGAATTVVDYNFKKTYGIAGQLKTEQEKVRIDVYHAGNKVSETYTTAYGYYQVLGLSKGNYVLKTANRPDKNVVLDDSIVFEVDL